MSSPTKLIYFIPFYLVVCVLGQDKPPVLIDTAPMLPDRFPASWYPAEDNVTYTLAVEKNLPYTATVVITDQYESDGEVITHKTSTLLARDSAGRRREEVEGGGWTDARGQMIPTRTITVSDPVSHCDFRWVEPMIESEKPFALVKCLPRTIHYINQNIWAEALKSFFVKETREQHSSNGSALLSEPLGTRTFGDAHAEGLRTTATNTNLQTGEVSRTVAETWYASDINELVQLTYEDEPGSGDLHKKQIPYMELTNIKRVEPTSTLFYPPQGFEIQMEDFK